MKKLEQFRIHLTSLKNNKVYNFDFELGASFFDQFDYKLFEKAEARVAIQLMKSSNLIEVDFLIQGTVGLVCDRSLKEFDYPINLNKKIIYKFGNEWNDENIDIVIIPRDTVSLDLSQPLYEFISLSIPMKKIHPDLSDQEKNEDTEFVYTSK